MNEVTQDDWRWLANVYTEGDNDTPLLEHAISQGRYTLVRQMLLVTAGRVHNTYRDSYNVLCAALSKAIGDERFDIADWCLQQTGDFGAEWHQTPEENIRCIDPSIFRSMAQLDYLVSRGWDINKRGEYGFHNTQLHYAAQSHYGHDWGEVEWLLAHGADKTLKNDMGHTPYDYLVAIIVRRRDKGKRDKQEHMDALRLLALDASLPMPAREQEPPPGTSSSSSEDE